MMGNALQSHLFLYEKYVVCSNEGLEHYNKSKKQDCFWKQKKHKITKIGDSVWLSFVHMQHCSLRDYSMLNMKKLKLSL